MNRYTYAANSPINRTDPTGHDSAEYAIPLSIFPTLGRAAGPIALFIYGTFALTASLWLLAHYFQLPQTGTIPGLQEEWNPSGNGSGSSGGGFNWGNAIITAVSILTLISILVNPNVYQDTVEETTTRPRPQREKPIVLDLGHSDNFEGEVMPLVNIYRGTARVVGVDMNPADLMLGWAATSMPGVRIPEDYDYIQADYASSGIGSIFAMRGYNQCAVAAYSFWPSDSAAQGLPNVTRQLLCSGKPLMVVSEDFDRITGIASQLRSMAYINGPVETTRDKIAQLGFWSNETYAKNAVQYLLIATKK